MTWKQAIVFQRRLRWKLDEARRGEGIVTFAQGSPEVTPGRWEPAPREIEILPAGPVRDLRPVCRTDTGEVAWVPERVLEAYEA